MHKISRRTLEYLKFSGVTTLFISRNLAELKTKGSKIRKKQRRHFHQIPLIKYLDYIELNASEYGVRVSVIDEAYTSRVNTLSGSVIKAQKLRKEINEAKKDGSNDIVENLEKKLGTALGGSRVKGKFTIKGSKSYYHADVGAAANHLQIGIGKIIEWCKNLRSKIFSPLVINIMQVLDKKHDWVSYRYPIIG